MRPVRRLHRPLVLALFALLLVAPDAQARGPAEDRALLRTRIEQLLSQPPLAGARISGEVVSLDDGTVLWSRVPDEKLNPASNTKIVTSAVALLRLGPEYKFTTDVLAEGGLAKGRVKALVVRGKADPTLDTEKLQSIASDLWHRGLRQVGDLVLDDTFLDSQPWGPGWESEDSDKPYAAPVGALSLNHNSVGIWVLAADRPGKAKVELEPEAKGFFALDNRVQTARSGSRKHLVPHTESQGDRTRVSVQGRVPAGAEPQVFWRRVTEPTSYFGYALREALVQRGIKVTGKVKRGTPSDKAELITSYDSPQLAEVVREMNKVSSNFQAEMILKTLGAEVKGVPGTWKKGVEAAEDVLEGLGLARGTYQLRNGSGLNDENRFSAHQLTTLLAAMWTRFAVAPEFVGSLSVAARDGTLRLRMEGTDAAGRLRAKTGTLDKVTALSGFLQAMGGERMVFSLLVNDWAGRAGPVVQGVDKFGALLASAGAPEPSPHDQSLVALADKAELTPAELKARLATYASLAAAPDVKNAPFLRAEIRAARDPLLKAAAADALFRTSAEEGGGPALLDVLPLGPELYQRLRAVGRELLLPLPLVSTLLDLGADGSAEALVRLTALAPLAVGPQAEPELVVALSEGLFDVSEAAPEEMRMALIQAPETQGQATLSLIAQGMAEDGQPPAQSALAKELQLASTATVPTAHTARRLLERLTRLEPPPPPAVVVPPGVLAPGAGAPGETLPVEVVTPPSARAVPGPASPLGPGVPSFTPPPFVGTEAPEAAPLPPPAEPAPPLPATPGAPPPAPPPSAPAAAPQVPAKGPSGEPRAPGPAPTVAEAKRAQKRDGRRRGHRSHAVREAAVSAAQEPRPGGG